MINKPRFQFSELNVAFGLGKLRAHHTHCSMERVRVRGQGIRWILGTSPRFYWLQRLKRDVNHQNRPRGAIDRSNPPNDPRSRFLLLNLSKKVEFHLFCINLDTGYLYVIVWIPKAFSLLSHHSRVVFTICNVSFLDGHYNLRFFTMFNLNLLFKKKSILILTFIHPTHRFIIALRKKIINLPLL